jgi:hypothetical protein
MESAHDGYTGNYMVFFTIHEAPSKQIIVHRVIYAKRNYIELF